MNGGFVFVGDFEPDPEKPLVEEPVVEGRYRHEPEEVDEDVDVVVIVDEENPFAWIESDARVTEEKWQ